MLEAISILLALPIGFLLVRAWDPTAALKPRWAGALFNSALGAGAGIGVTSVLFLLLDTAGVASQAAVFGTDTVLAAGLGFQLWRSRQAKPPIDTSGAATPRFRWTWVLAIVFSAVFVMALVRLIQMAIALPVGDWDAWALWNLRAKFLAGPGDAWRYAVSPLLSNSHPDYPLLLPAFVAHVWTAAATVDAIGPAMTALLFFAALVGLIVGAVALLRGTASGLLAGLVLLCTTSLLLWAPSQYADVPAAYYYAGAIALLFLEAARGENTRWALLWAGLCASFAAWTKNEGIAFLAVTLAVFSAFTFWRRRTEPVNRTMWLLTGAAPGLLLTLWLKFFLAPAVDPLVTQGTSAAAKLRDFTRYVDVAQGFSTNLLHLGSGLSHPLILLAILALLVRWQLQERYRPATLIATTIVSLMLLSFCAVYLITPYGLKWQVQSSFDRLIVQVWPAFLLIFFVQLRSIEDTAISSAPAIKKAVARKLPPRKTAGVK